MKQILEFFAFNEPNVQMVLIGTIFMLTGTSLVGCFSFLRKRSLVGDVIAHSLLPGICLAFILFKTKNILVLLTGATITGWLSIFIMDYIVAQSRIKTDAAMGLVLSVFFGIGIVLLTIIQQRGASAQSGLDSFLFGKAAAINHQDVYSFFLISLIIIISIIIFYKPFKLLAFDEEFARSMGVPTRIYEVLLSVLTVLAIAVGIQAVGVVLIAAMIIAPAATARYWTNDLRVMLILSVVFAIIAGIAGVFVSYSQPKMPTGPWIVVFISFFVFISVLFSPQRGVISRIILRRHNRRKILGENILKTLYRLGEIDGLFQTPRFIGEILSDREIPAKDLTKGLKILERKKYVGKRINTWMLTEKGEHRAKRILKLHRLWELYLTKYLRLASDHVHDEAEAIEHVITPELEQTLEKLLDYPTTDPHGRTITYH